MSRNNLGKVWGMNRSPIFVGFIKGSAVGNYYGGIVCFTALYFFPGQSGWMAFILLFNVLIGRYIMFDTKDL